MINELYVPVFTAYITGLTEPFLVLFKEEIFIIFDPKENCKSCKTVSDYYFYFLNTMYLVIQFVVKIFIFKFDILYICSMLTLKYLPTCIYFKKNVLNFLFT